MLFCSLKPLMASHYTQDKIKKKFAIFPTRPPRKQQLELDIEQQTGTK